MANLSDLDNRMNRLSKKLSGEVNKFVRKVAFIADQNVVFATPVDTGRARSNWLVSVNSPVNETIQPYKAGSALGVGEVANASAATDQALAALAGRRNDQDIYIQNNLVYISRLNEGHSQQAPANFVQMAVKNAVNTALKIKL